VRASGEDFPRCAGRSWPSAIGWPEAGRGQPSLAVDRVFSIRGRGTVVTGSLRGGPIARGDFLRVVPGPSDARIRVREVQVHNRQVDRAEAGRVALNVVGPSVGSLTRGAVLTADSAVVPTDRLPSRSDPDRSAVARCLARPPADRTRVTVHLHRAVAAVRPERTRRLELPRAGQRDPASRSTDRRVARGWFCAPALARARGGRPRARPDAAARWRAIERRRPGSGRHASPRPDLAGPLADLHGAFQDLR
jgi:hypothetical protein